jgi:hypothetical protein
MPNFDRFVQEGSGNAVPLSMGALSGETWREGFFTGDYKKYVIEGPGNGAALSIQGLHKGDLQGRFLHSEPREAC